MITARLKLVVDSPILWPHIKYRMFSLKRGWLDSSPQSFEVKNNGAYGITKIYDCFKDEKLSCEVAYGPNKKVNFKVLALEKGSFDQSIQKLPSSTSTQNPDFSNKKDVKIPPKPIPKAIIFFIGGAGDKRPFSGTGPNGNITYVQSEYIQRRNKELTTDEIKLLIDSPAMTYLGYYEIYGIDNIKKNVIDKIQSKNILVYIVGHSLGGWNGAHLSDVLVQEGYKVKMLITLDPVGTKVGITAVADIPWKYPKGSAETWINISCSPRTKTPKDFYDDAVGNKRSSSYDFTDLIADSGGQWRPKSGPTNNVETAANHRDAELIMRTKVVANLTGLDLFMASIRMAVK